MSNSKVRIEGSIENECCSTIFIEPSLDTQSSRFGLQKTQNDHRPRSKTKVIIKRNQSIIRIRQNIENTPDWSSDKPLNKI